MAIFKYLRVAAAALVVLHVAVAQKCYYPNGNPAPDTEKPCSSAPGSACCPDKWTCMDNGLCYYEPDKIYGRYSCTDKDWKSSGCPSNLCTYDMSAAGAEAITQCASHNNNWCCDGDRNTVDCCNGIPDPRPFFQLQNPVAYGTAGGKTGSSAPNLATITGKALSGNDDATSATPTSASRSASRSSASGSPSSGRPVTAASVTGSTSRTSASLEASSPTSTATSSPTPTATSTQANSPPPPPPKTSNLGLIIGLAVGIPLALTLLAIIFWLLRKRRHMKTHPYDYTATSHSHSHSHHNSHPPSISSPTDTAAPPYTGHAFSPAEKQAHVLLDGGSEAAGAGRDRNATAPLSLIPGKAELDSGLAFGEGRIPFSPDSVGVGGGTGRPGTSRPGTSAGAGMGGLGGTMRMGSGVGIGSGSTRSRGGRRMGLAAAVASRLPIASSMGMGMGRNASAAQDPIAMPRGSSVDATQVHPAVRAYTPLGEGRAGGFQESAGASLPGGMATLPTRSISPLPANSSSLAAGLQRGAAEGWTPTPVTPPSLPPSPPPHPGTTSSPLSHISHISQLSHTVSTSGGGPPATGHLSGGLATGLAGGLASSLPGGLAGVNGGMQGGVGGVGVGGGRPGATSAAGIHSVVGELVELPSSRTPTATPTFPSGVAELGVGRASPN